MFFRESGEYKTDYKRDMTLYALPISRFAVGLMVLLFFVAAPLLMSEYQLTLLSLVAIAVVGALGLNILVGYAGQLSIGHAAFMSVGAYTAANLVTKLDMPFLLTLPAGGLMAAAVGLIVGIPSLRIKGIYLAIATLAAQFIIEWIINHSPSISGGVQASIEIDQIGRASCRERV